MTKPPSLNVCIFVLGILLLPSQAHAQAHPPVHAVCPAAPVGSSADSVIQMVAGPDGLVQMGPDSVVDATEEGAIVYDATNDSIAVCDGTNWVVLGGAELRTDCGTGSELEWDGTEWQCTVAAAEACETGTIGTRCTSDGAIYAGDTVGGARMYAAACDHGMTWNGTACTGGQTMRQLKTTNTTTAGTTSSIDGVANTDAMATAGIALHPAAESCRNVGPEWYLPSLTELALLYNNLVGVGWVDVDLDNFTDDFWFNVSSSFPAGSYWASWEDISGIPRVRNFFDGNQGPSPKNVGVAVRCVRR